MKNHKIHILILIILIILASIFVISNLQTDRENSHRPVTYGISFDPTYAKYLGLDPKSTYQSILKDLSIKNIRLSALWDRIEPLDSAQGKPFYFEELDWYVSKATQNKAQVILAIGFKLPRWPECRVPRWLETRNEELRTRQLIMLKAVIEYYEKNPTIVAWQLENEPLLEFGVCPKPDRQFLQKEVEFVRSKTSKPIIISDSGELRPWVTPMKLSDIFGTTLYRIVETPIIGQFYYPLRPWFYRIKSDLVRKFFAPQNQKTIIVELQTETWSNRPLSQTPVDEQIQNFTLQQFKDTIDFARKTGFSEIYLWGVEWWYYLLQNGHPEYLQYAKSLFF
ncbi:cellulase family glycosylhydrolase [Candidatus Daviesbacteria bacterium]|nr:cellulase family glycosylhydrolase [Candidatus Daviesbacteria bacterium]